jgi:hypothetical protein
LLINLALVPSLLIGIWSLAVGLRFLQTTVQRELSRAITGFLAGLAISLVVGGLLVQFHLIGSWAIVPLSFVLSIGAMLVTWRWIVETQVILMFFWALLFLCSGIATFELAGRFGLQDETIQGAISFAFCIGAFWVFQQAEERWVTRRAAQAERQADSLLDALAVEAKDILRDSQDIEAVVSFLKYKALNQTGCIVVLRRMGIELEQANKIVQLSHAWAHLHPANEVPPEGAIYAEMPRVRVSPTGEIIVFGEQPISAMGRSGEPG